MPTGQTILTLDSKFLTLSECPLVMTGDRPTDRAQWLWGGVEEGVPPRRGSAARHAPSLGDGRSVSYCPKPRPPSLRSQLGKSGEAPTPGPGAARTSGPFCTRLPRTAGPQPAGARTIPGLVAGGGAARVAKVTRARGRRLRRSAGRAGGGGGGCTMSGRKRSFTFGAYGG